MIESQMYASQNVNIKAIFGTFDLLTELIQTYLTDFKAV